MESPAQLPRRWLVTGSSAGERRPVGKGDAPSERWFEPLHVQDPVAARERVAAQIAAGADVVSAPTWRTHRRALMEVGESRRAREWTEAAVRIAREGIDAGFEEREATVVTSAEPESDTESGGEDAVPPIPLERDPPTVAGILPSLDDEPEAGSGRLLPREPAAARDYEEAAGHLADAAVDLILVETRPGDRGLRTAVEAGARTGLPTWVAVTGPLPDGSDTQRLLASWAETAIDAGASGLLFPDGTPEIGARVAEGFVVPTWGGVIGEVGDRAPDRLADGTAMWLDAGASAVALLRGARPDRIAAVRSAIDSAIRGALEADRAERDRWEAAVRHGASMAPGGAAVWLGEPSATDPAMLPAGFSWTVARHAEAHHLPRERYRLVVVPAGAGVVPSEVAGLLDAGGILVTALEADTGPAASLESVRLLAADRRGRPAYAIYRREA